MDRQQYQGQPHTAGEVKRDSGVTGRDSDIPILRDVGMNGYGSNAWRMIPY